ncbi:O-antigen ligase family protein [Marivirga arenosa]|uniref:O-antigen ligase family protein n=1 Tax=Marivirga arenosa TaxID=3059076 RepID=A0AA51ZVZ0_9BACT|nr:O-antigen ligase family protein [Marivirga sp. BKB1-2]WNB17743.1 O-antigen ligase family protein [Marivirga sp. BKB1-2]
MFRIEQVELSSFLNFSILLCVIISVIGISSKENGKFLRDLNAFLSIYLIASFSLAVYEHITLKHLPLSASYLVTTIWDGYYHAPSGFFTNQNDFALVFVMATMFKLSYLKKGKKNHLINWLLIIMCLWITHVTGSRLNLMGFIIFLAFYFRFWELKKLLLIGISSIIIISFFSYIFVNSSFSLKGHSTNTRINLYYQALLSIPESYGVGYGIDLSKNFYQDRPSNAGISNFINPHSYIFELLINSGILTFIVYLSLYALILRKAIVFKTRLDIFIQLILYNLLLFSSSSSLFLWPHYFFFVVYINYEFLKPKDD